MRLELYLPDNVLPEVKQRLTSIFKRLGERPELAENLYLDTDESFVLTKEMRAKVEEGIASVKAGRLMSEEEAHLDFEQRRSEWLARRTA